MSALFLALSSSSLRDMLLSNVEAQCFLHARPVWTLKMLSCSFRAYLCFTILRSESRYSFIQHYTSRFLGVFPKSRKATITFVTYVRPSFCKEKLGSFGNIFLKYYISVFFEKFVLKIQVSLNSDSNNKYFTWRPMYIWRHISFISS